YRAVRRKQPSSHTANKRDELAPGHSITSSARASSLSGFRDRACWLHFFRLHGTVLPPAGVESGLVAHSTGPTQNRTRTSRSRLIEPSRCSCMPLLEPLVSQFFGRRLRAQFPPTEQGAHSYQRSAPARP